MRRRIGMPALKAAVLVLTLCPIAASAADSLGVFLLGPGPGERSICELRFRLSQPLPPRASFRVQFASGFDLSEVLLVGSDRIDGGLSFRRDGNQIIVSRSGLGHGIPAGELLDLKIANLRTPSVMSEAGPVRVTILGPTETLAELAARAEFRSAERGEQR
ncbi:MAG: hypothetical protein ONB23_11855 [candidate division KSB1 bacterium]|nr:hypothetical protein [candidate division KSB1 bacterium]